MGSSFAMLECYPTMSTEKHQNQIQASIHACMSFLIQREGSILVNLLSYGRAMQEGICWQMCNELRLYSHYLSVSRIIKETIDHQYIKQ